MKKFILFIMLSVAISSIGLSDKPIHENFTEQQVQQIEFTNEVQLQQAFRIYFDALEPGSPITISIPVGFTDPRVCCALPGGCSPPYCCWKC